MHPCRAHTTTQKAARGRRVPSDETSLRGSSQQLSFGVATPVIATNSITERILLSGLAFFRFAVCGTIVWFGFYFVSWFGTCEWGLSVSGVLSDLLFALLFLGPSSLVPFIGCRCRTALVGACITFAAAFIPGEVFSRAQEFQAIQTYGVAPDHDIVIDRWAPYEHHTIAYNKDKGWTGWD